MNRIPSARASVRLGLMPAGLALVLAACGTTPTSEIRGRWVPVNRFSPTTQEIPLQAPYVYQATPMDRTLKAMLERWARDKRMTLAWQHGSDFTLHAPMADLRTGDLGSAVARINEVYAPQQVQVAVEGDRIVVRRTGTP
ncbi:TcpQ domain-containing protein [Lysobacter humi (ex Lee et al. 2017)]